MYSGSIIKPKFIPQFIDLLNSCNYAEKINLIFFSRGLSDADFNELRSNFTGTIQSPGYIPIEELLTIYKDVDAFMSFPGDINSIRSKVFEYMSYGHPLLLLYDNSQDVNVKTFSKYPLCKSLNLMDSKSSNAKELDNFINKMIGKLVPFCEVSRLFPLDTPAAYVNLIKNLSNVN